MKISKSVFIIGLALLFVQCESPHFYQQTASTSDGWDKDKTLSFDFEIKDTTKRYDFYLLSRNDNSYPYSNLYLLTEMTSPSGEKFSDTIQYFLSYPDGEWLGKGNNLKELYLLYRENISLKDTGKYRLKIRQGMREDKLKGIEDLSLIIDKKAANEKRK